MPHTKEKQQQQLRFFCLAQKSIVGTGAAAASSNDSLTQEIASMVCHASRIECFRSRIRRHYHKHVMRIPDVKPLLPAEKSTPCQHADKDIWKCSLWR